MRAACGHPRGKSRAITEPTSEALLRGPRLGFTEILSDNTAMLRLQGRTEQMEIKKYVVGNVIKRDLAIVYMKNIVNPELLQEVEQRIAKIDLDYIAESGYVEQLIEDDILSPFQQAQNTERPDRVMSALVEGRIALLLDGTPFALIVPVTFSMLLQSPEDYYERWMAGSLLRMLRFVAAFMSLIIPSMYISFISFHPGLIPTELAITIIEARQRVPFPSLIEVLIMEVSIEILREAGVRLPRPIGSAMGIVGGLIIGEAAVQAGIVSPFLVIVVSVTAIASFSIPMYSAGITLRMLRFVGMFLQQYWGYSVRYCFFADLQPSDQAGKLRCAICHALFADPYRRLEGLVRPCALDINETQTRIVEDGPQTTQILNRKARRGSLVYSHQRQNHLIASGHLYDQQCSGSWHSNVAPGCDRKNAYPGFLAVCIAGRRRCDARGAAHGQIKPAVSGKHDFRVFSKNCRESDGQYNVPPVNRLFSGVGRI